MAKEFNSCKIKEARVPTKNLSELKSCKKKYSKLDKCSILNMCHKKKPLQYFMYNPKRKELLLASEGKGITSHADVHDKYSTVKSEVPREFLQMRGYSSDYDKFIKGWAGVSKQYPNGIIHFHSHTPTDQMLEVIDVFKENGANCNTIVRNAPIGEKKMCEIHPD